MDLLTFGKEIFALEMEELNAVMNRLDESFLQAVGLISDCMDRKGKVVIVGIGKSGHIGSKIAATLSSTGAPSLLLNSQDALHGDLGIVQDGDVCIAMSHSGETGELLSILPHLKRYDMPIIAMTGNVKSTLAEFSDVVLDTSIKREACPLNLAPTSSTTVMLVMGDALAMALLKARNFSEEDFAKSHPGGALGRALLTKVRDIMRKEGEMAVVTEDATINDALNAMNKTRSGACVIIDAGGKLAGILTHGDFVRSYQSDVYIGQKSVQSLMTKNPITVRAGALAAEAVRTLGSRRIDDLVVLDEDRYPVGLVDTQDLARLKLV